MWLAIGPFYLDNGHGVMVDGKHVVRVACDIDKAKSIPGDSVDVNNQMAVEKPESYRFPCSTLNTVSGTFGPPI